MSKSLKGARLVGSFGLQEREKNDFYATPPKSVEALLDLGIIDGESFYEPCVGLGHISNVIRKYFPKAKIYESDLIDRGVGVGNVNFLEEDILNGEKVDWIITNPPYKYAVEFAERSLQLTTKGVAFFLPIRYLETERRSRFLENTPLKYVYVFRKRQSTWRNGIPYNPETGKPWKTVLCMCWFIWEHDYEGEPVIRWL